MRPDRTGLIRAEWPKEIAQHHSPNRQIMIVTSLGRAVGQQFADFVLLGRCGLKLQRAV
jgi:hypothetical protein